MQQGWKRIAALAALVMVFSPLAWAKSDGGDDGRLQRFVIVLQDAPLAGFAGGQPPGVTLFDDPRQFEATSPAVTGARKLDLRSVQSRAYLAYLDQARGAFELDAAVLLGRSLRPVRIYRTALNGVAADLTPAEAAALAKSPYVKSVSRDRRQRLDTDAGPEWIGAAEIWNGGSGFPDNKGEGVVVGVIDSGINWDHPSFADPGSDGYSYGNPFGSPLGLCSDPEVKCNDKLVGVYDFVEDDPDTEVVEENTKGKDNSGHGSHVASTAAGNVLNVKLNGSIDTVLSGVAPHANIVAYRVCYIGDPPDPEGGGCMGSAILAAIDQAVEDGVDVINYSIGTSAFNPWAPGEIPMAYLNARNAGIFVVTSAGNDGPNAGTMGSPANAPWVSAAGNGSSNRIFASMVQNLSGGSTTPPGNLVGASLTAGLSTHKIVYAGDYGFPLCGTGEAELASTCSSSTGASNPWSGQHPFNGEIVVCDRGTYGRVEKGKNLLLAGAGGYILANTELDGESIVADDHCLPASHIGEQDGDTLRNWLAGGSNHMGSISGFTLFKDDKYGDLVNSSSARGPNPPPVQDILKPNMIAPGTSILAASDQGSQFLTLSGTSMASPHIAGAAALVRAVHPDWSVAQIASSLETTSTAALARDAADGEPATPHVRGSGRPQLGEAVNAGLYLDVSDAQFKSANPTLGGKPKNLNLSGLVDAACQGSCAFSRTVKDQMGGGNWTASAAHFPAGVAVSIAPASFSLANHGTQALNISIDLGSSAIVGEWVYGEIVLSAAGSPDQALTVAVYSSGGALPAQWDINDNRDTGWKDFSLDGLVALPDATFTSGGLVAPTKTTQTLKQDPSNSNPLNGGEGAFTVWHNLPQGGLWLHAETLASTAPDLDLFVGRDDDGDGVTDEDEQLCESSSPDNVESCDLFNLPPGNYWVVAQNWEGNLPDGDVVTLVSAAIASSDHSSLVATGPGIVAADENFTVRASWSNVNALSGQEWLGAVGIGTQRGSPNNIGVIPVYFHRSGYEAAQTLPLMNATAHKLALPANSAHDRMFFDVPPGVTSLNVSAHGASSAQNNALSLQVYRQDFSTALSSPPFAQLPGGLSVVASAAGSGGTGPAVTLSNPVTQGRYFVKLSNSSGSGVAASITATATSSASNLNPHRGLWDADRNNYQGAEWNGAGSTRFTVWYTYDDDGQPTWYIASGGAATGNIWTADLLRVTNDGEQQQENVVGKLSVTFVANNRMVYSYSMLGQAGFDSMHPNSANTCPVAGGSPRSYTGHWYRGIAGLGGATVLAYAAAEAQVHYIYDGEGVPRWLIGAHDEETAPQDGVLQLLQFSGYCAVCTPVEVSWHTAGEVDYSFASDTAGDWTLDFSLDAPLSQTISRSDQVVKLSDTLSCE
jgi:subtilisin family serine protease